MRAISVTFARTVSSGSCSRCRRTCGDRPGDQRGRRPRCRRRLADGADASITWRSPDPTAPTRGRVGPNAFGGYQLDARVATLQEQALGALINHAQIQSAAAAAARRSGVVSDGCCSAIRFGSSRTPSAPASRRCRIPIRRSPSWSNRVRSSSSAPAPSATAARTSRPRSSPVPRFHDISTQCPRPVDTVDAGAIRVRGLPAAAGAQRADLRNLVAERRRRRARAPIPAGRC